jgi:predicted ester cyclase
MSTEEAIAVVRRNTEEVQGKGNYEVFEELFAKDFVDHTPQPGGFSADRDGARNLYKALRTAFPDFHAEIHWQISDGDRVTTFKTYHGTHLGEFWGIARMVKIFSRASTSCSDMVCIPGKLSTQSRDVVHPRSEATLEF